jgi:hypothetical protein
MGKPVEPVILERRWDVSSLLGETFKLFFKHAPLFITVTALVAVPYVVALDLVMGDTGDDPTDIDWAAAVVPLVLGSTVVPALITSLHAVALLRMSEGERPSVGEAFSLAFARLGAVIGAILLYILVVALGLILLIIPGIWLAVRLYFSAQAAVIDGLGPRDALRRSAELVKDRWWITVGRFILAGIVFGLATIPLSVPLGLIDYGAVYIVLHCVVQTVNLSLTALFGTLVFFDYRGAKAGHGGFEPPRPPDTHGFG